MEIQIPFSTLSFIDCPSKLSLLLPSVALVLLDELFTEAHDENFWKFEDENNQ